MQVKDATPEVHRQFRLTVSGAEYEMLQNALRLLIAQGGNSYFGIYTSKYRILLEEME